MKVLRLAKVATRPLPITPSKRFKQPGAWITTVEKPAFRHLTARSFATSTTSRAADARPEDAGSQAERKASTKPESSQNTGDTAQPAATGSQIHSQESITSQFNDLIAPRNPTSRRRKSLGLNSTQSVMADRQGALAGHLGLPVGDISRSMQNSYGGLSTGMPPDLPHRLDAYIGRTQNVSRYVPLASAIRMMDMQLSVNRVRTEHMQQRFHERPGLKRKRLKSSRWRKRFNEGFKATVAKVIRMRNMGW